MQTPTLHWETLPLATLSPATYNPRKKLKKGDKTYQQIQQSLQTFGYVDPIIVNADRTVMLSTKSPTTWDDLATSVRNIHSL